MLKHADPKPDLTTLDSATLSVEQKKTILKERAMRLAEEPNHKEAGLITLEILEFRIGKERYGIETIYISKVNPLEYLTSLPGLPIFIVGVINVHGNIIPVIDIKKFFDISVHTLSDLSKAIIVKTPGGTLGILADEVLGIIEIPITEMQANVPTLTGVHSDYLKGVTLSQMAILDPNKISFDKRIVVDQEI